MLVLAQHVTDKRIRLTKQMDPSRFHCPCHKASHISVARQADYKDGRWIDDFAPDLHQAHMAQVRPQPLKEQRIC
jgi:hypothetical protein